MLYVAGYYFVMGVSATAGILAAALTAEYIINKFFKKTTKEND